MARRLILDTGVLVAAERDGNPVPFARSEDDLAVAAVTIAELAAGLELSAPRHRQERRAFLQSWLDAVAVEPYDLPIALAHGRLLAHTRSAGRPRGAHDLIIAATALATERTIVTTDRRARFDELPGVEVLHV